MSEAQTIVRILPLKTLIKAVFNAASHAKGCMPTRIVASPTQVDKWADDVRASPHWRELGLTKLHILNIPVEEGPYDCQPELIWSSPIVEVD